MADDEPMNVESHEGDEGEEEHTDGSYEMDAEEPAKAPEVVEPPKEMTIEEKAAFAAELKSKGNDFYKKGDYYRALDMYSAAINAAPDSVPAEKATYYGNRAAACIQLKKFEDVIPDCLEAIKLDPTFSKGYLRAGQAYLQLGQIDEARPMLQKAAEMDPSCSAREELQHAKVVEEEMARGQTQLAAGNISSAFSSFSSALRYASQSKRLRLWKAECYIGMEQYAEASALASDVLREDQTLVDGLYLRGLAKYYLDETDAATQHFRQALQLDPDHKRSATFLKLARNLKTRKEEGNNAFKAGNYQAAVDAYTAALAMDPKNKKMNATLYTNRATANSKLKKHAEAVDDCTKAIELDDRYLKAYLRRAASYSVLEDYQNAVYDYNRAKDIDPTNRDIAQNLRQAQADLKKSKRKDLYKILGVAKDASEREIKIAFKKKALQWHPDKNMDSPEQKAKAEQMFRDVNEAYSILSDAEKRAQYDEGHEIQDIDSGAAAHGHGGFGGMNPNDLFSMFMNRGGGGFGGGGGGGGFGGFHFG